MNFCNTCHICVDIEDTECPNCGKTLVSEATEGKEYIHAVCADRECIYDEDGCE